MKILALNLTAFGPFTNASLDLSDGQEGLHIVFGPNEAGKSSTLRAITDLLFGIHPRTPDDFIHPYRRLRIGARLKHSDGTILDLVRRKANHNSLRLGDDATPLDDGELRRFRGDIDRDVFQVMFGIDHERLRRGGEEIVRGDGQIGELLFAAGAGLADLQKVQTRLQDALDRLFKPSGRSGTIVASIKEFQDNRISVKHAQVSVETWKSHDEALHTAQNQKASRDEAMRKKHSQRNRLTRILAAVAPIGRWRKTAEDLADIGAAPLLREDFADTSNAVLTTLRIAEKQQEDAKNTIATIDRQLDMLDVPEELVRESDAIESLRDRLGGYRKAMLDRPKLETSRELAEAEAKEILRKLGRPPDLSAIEDLRLPADKTIRIQNLGNQQEGLIERLKSTRRDCKKTRQAIASAESKLKDVRVSGEATSLRISLRDTQKEGDLESQLEAARRDVQILEQNATIALKQLSLWSGSLAEAEALAIPSLATVDRFDDELKETNGRIELLHNRLQEEIDTKENLEAALLRLELDQRVPTKDELDAMRQLREQGWQLVLKAWQDGQEDENDIATFLQEFTPLQSLSEAYRRSVDQADHIADILRNDADRVATKAKLQVDRNQRISREAVIGSEIEQAQAELRDVENRWKAVWDPFGFTPLSPVEMRDWLRRQQEISKAAKSIREKQLEADQLQLRIDSIRDELASALKQVEPESAREHRSLRELLQIASSKCDEIQKTESHLEQISRGLESDRSELVDAESRFTESEAALSRWQSDWAAEMLRLGLGDDAVPSQANSVLADVGNLFQKHQEADTFCTRIEGIDREACDFETAVRDLAERVAPDLTTKSVDETVSLLTSQLQAARSTKEQYGALAQQRNEQQKKLQNAAAQISDINASLAEMCRQAGCTANDQLSDAARRSSRRQELERSVRDLEEQIISQSGGADLAAFVSETEKEAADVDSLQPRIDELDGEIARLVGERDEFVRQIEREESELQKIDGSALAAEKEAECESIASHLEDQVQELAVLRASSAILHAGIEQHRKENQGPVLGRASDIFSQITLGSFEGLRADFNERGEPVLTGVRCGNRETIPVSGMSDGTCDQLYLALRLASLETWLDRHEAVPFIVDDVLLNFDDDRAVASLQVLAELSHRTQVIFFTHHNHLVEMAKSNLSSQDLFVTTLADGTTGE